MIISEPIGKWTRAVIYLIKNAMIGTFLLVFWALVIGFLIEVII